MDLDTWWDSGRRLAVRAASGEHTIFRRVEGQGPWTTFLHGFPTSSYDWHEVAARLPSGRRRLYVDHLGFGASDKPRAHRYSFDEQVELLQGVWRQHHVAATVLVAHDYSVSMAQEILYRQNRGRWDGPRIGGVVLLNGGLFHSVQRPLPVQRLLRSPVTGPLMSRLVTRRAFDGAMHRILHPDHRLAAADLDEHWQAIARDRGPRVAHLLSRYHEERKRNEQRYTAGLQHALVRMRFLWGLADPVSGRNMLDEARRRVKVGRFVQWDDVGHYPQLEVPDRVAMHIADVESYFLG